MDSNLEQTSLKFSEIFTDNNEGYSKRFMNVSPLSTQS